MDDHLVVEHAIPAAVAPRAVPEGRSAGAYGIVAGCERVTEALEAARGSQVRAGVVDTGESQGKVPGIGARALGDHGTSRVADADVEHGEHFLLTERRAVVGAPVRCAGSGGHGLSALVPRTGADGGAHHFIQGKDPGVVRTADEIEPLIVGRIVTLDVHVGTLGRSLGVEEDDAVHDAAPGQLGLLAAADVGGVAVQAELEDRLPVMVPGPGHIGGIHDACPDIGVRMTVGLAVAPVSPRMTCASSACSVRSACARDGVSAARTVTGLVRTTVPSRSTCPDRKARSGNRSMS